jgi:Fic family protein
MLARSENSSQRFYSMSAQIRKQRESYYQILETTQKGDIDVTEWLQWFVSCLNGALDHAEGSLKAVLDKSRFWTAINDTELNERQRKVLNRLVDDFEGKLTSSKWARLAKCSQDTAARDIADLMLKGILIRGPAGGRSTSYELVAGDLLGSSAE